MRTDTEYLRLAVEIARTSKASGNHPFGALLVGPDGDVLLTQVFAAGRRHVDVRGPFADLEDEISNDHKGFW